MPSILITGATGTVGSALAEQLVAAGHDVRALVRDVARGGQMLGPGVTPVRGDVTDADSVRAAVDGCERVFHAAGLPEQWRLSHDDFQQVNVLGTQNVIDACRERGVARLIYTSTIDVFAWTPGVPFDESVLDPEPRPTVYERSKQDADRRVAAAVADGLDAVFIHPAAVYGPAPMPAGGYGALNGLLARLAERKIPALLAGGMPVVHTADVAAGQIAAADQAPSGARYILSDAYLTLRQMAEIVKGHTPTAKVPPVMPMPLAAGMAIAGEAVARVIKRPPLVARGEQIFLGSHAVPNAERARRELGWQSRSPAVGITETLDAITGARA